MAFIIDKQTLDDLNILGKHRGGSIYHLFNTTQTRGGAQILEEMFQYPLSDRHKIRQRSEIIQYFQEKNVSFPFRNEAFDAIEHYLENTDERTMIAAEEDTLQRKLRGLVGADVAYEQLQKGILSCIEVMSGLRDFLGEMDVDNAARAFRLEVREMQAILLDEQLSWVYGEKGSRKLAYAVAAKYDQVLRFAARDKIKKLLHYIYQMDVYMAVARVASTRGFVFAEMKEMKENVLQIEEMYHPLIKDPVANSMRVDSSNNVIFLTGANMAGKSTFMKTFGILVYLAHMGFPVPARRVMMSVRSGMFTTINLADNLNMGYSHFYAEVLRLKKVAEQVGRTENLVVIFDELFRGTNVKDAYDATVAVTEAFAEKRNCMFVISTHIIEAGEPLGEKCDNINFVYFPTVMEGNVPRYTYRLASGITNDRHGMRIVRNEGIIDIIAARQEKTGATGFAVDKQTLDDLNLLGRYKGGSIFNLFDHTHTRGGAQLLESMFLHPLTDAEAINMRSSIFQYFQTKAVKFPVSKELCDDVEHYMSSTGGGSLMGSALAIGRKRLLRDIASDKEYEMIHAGILSTIGFMHALNDLFGELGSGLMDYPYRGTIQEVKDIFNSAALKSLLAERGTDKLSFWKVVRYDHLLRHVYREKLRRVIDVTYEIDVYATVSRVAEERKFSYAWATPFVEGENRIDMINLYHPQLPGAVANSIRTDHMRNMIFLTGANMAGKSTCMKSFGVAVYLAHMGFPVAAEGMMFSVQDGMYTSINVADNLDRGYSHFYAEVLRVRQVAEEISRGKNLVVIFDELFKGTNVKDAYDATVAVTEAFAENRNASFIVSTHITEAGETLREHCPHMKFVYFPTVMEKGMPRYTYRLQEGISSDRHGMMIIEHEGILDIIKRHGAIA